MHELFEHTADLGLRARSADLNALFAEAGLAFSSATVDDLRRVEPRQRVAIELTGQDEADLLFDFLNELLFIFETRRLVFCDFTVNVRQGGLTAEARGEPFDEARHGGGHEIKAITYHRLRVERTDDGWLAEVIVDI